MPYTVWSRGRLIGESALDYRRVFPRHRMGDFYPTDVGETIMPIATGVSKAGADLVKSLSGAPPGSSARMHLRETSEYADLAAAEDRYDALELELRAPDGRVIPTEWIDLRDTEFLFSLAPDEELHAHDLELDFLGEGNDDFGDPPTDFDAEPPDFELAADIDSDDEAPWLPGHVFPRYQLQVMLRDDAAVP